MVISTDKSIVVSSLKHGSTMAYQIFNEYVNSVDPSIQVRREDVFLVAYQNLGKLLNEDSTKICTYKESIRCFYNDNFAPPHLRVIDPVNELFNTLYGKSNKPIYFLIRDTFHSYYSAFITDFSHLLIEKYKIACQLVPELSKYVNNEDNLKHSINSFLGNPQNIEQINFLISQFCKLFYKELANSPHLSSAVNPLYANILDQISINYPSALKNVYLVDLTRYDRTLNNYLIEQKVIKFRVTGEGKKNINTNLSVFENIISTLISFGKDLPLFEIRNANEAKFYKYIRQAYKTSLVRESNYIDIFKAYS